MFDGDVDQLAGDLLDIDAPRAAAVGDGVEALDIRRVLGVLACEGVEHEDEVTDDLREAGACGGETLAADKCLDGEEHADLVRGEAGAGVAAGVILRAMGQDALGPCGIAPSDAIGTNARLRRGGDELLEHVIIRVLACGAVPCLGSIDGAGGEEGDGAAQ